MNRIVQCLVIIISLLATGATARANMRIALVGAGTMPTATETLTPSNRILEGQIGYGAGVLIGLPLGSHMEFETGGIYGQFIFDRTIAGATTLLAGWNVHVPFVFNYWFNRHIALSVGGFADSGIGKFSNSGTPTTLSYGDLGIRNVNYGLEGGLGFSFPLGGASLIIDGRYSYGLREMRIDTSIGQSTIINNVVGLVGLRFGGGHK